MTYYQKKENDSAKNRQSLCIDLLNAFSEKEIEGLNHFIKCRYFNTDRYVVTLLDTLKREVVGRREFNNKIRCSVYQKVFPDPVVLGRLSQPQKKRLSAKLNALTRLAEQFLAIEGLEEKEIYYNDLLSQKLMDKKQYQLFNRHINKVCKRLEAEPKKNIIDYEHQYKIEANQLNYLHRSGEILKRDNLPELIQNLDVHYLLSKLSLNITLLSYEAITPRVYDSSSMEAMSALLNLPQYDKHPFILIYRVTIDLVKNRKEAAYRKLLELLDYHAVSIPREELKGVYITVTNFCVQQIRKGQFDYRELFELYRMMDEKNLFIEGGLMSEIKLKNITVAACRVGEFEWAESIVEKYQPFIKKQVKEPVFRFNMGVIAFYQNDYKTAIHHFIRVENVNLNYDINCRVMMMKSYYEIDKDYDERTMQIFRSTEKFFNENKALTPKAKKGYKNFIRTLINLYRIRHMATKMKLKSIKTKLEQQEVNSDKFWLLEKIGALE